MKEKKTEFECANCHKTVSFKAGINDLAAWAEAGERVALDGQMIMLGVHKGYDYRCPVCRGLLIPVHTPELTELFHDDLPHAVRLFSSCPLALRCVDMEWYDSPVCENTPVNKRCFGMIHYHLDVFHDRGEELDRFLGRLNSRNTD